MASHEDELLDVARLLIRRRSGLRGPLPSARVRRSVSTSYYAIFHFIANETAGRLVGKTSNLLKRRRLLSRTITHASVRSALDKLKGKVVEKSVDDFFALPGNPQPNPVPPFVQFFATSFAGAQAQREDADYDLTKPLTAADATLIRRQVKRAIELWKNASATSDTDFKNAISALIVLKGRLRKEG